MILRLFEQDVQISGTKTGSLVCATLKNYEAVRVSAGHDIGVSFFDVQEARMSQLHGCTEATLGTSFFRQVKKSFVHGCTYTAIAWMRKSSELAGKRRNKC